MRLQLTAVAFEEARERDLVGFHRRLRPGIPSLLIGAVRHSLIGYVVHYALPLGLAGEAAYPIVRRHLIRIVDYRQRAVRAVLRGER